MKKIIISAFLLIVSAPSFSQQTKPSAALIKQGYLHKSKYLNKAAWLCLGGGTALFLTSIAVVPKNYDIWYDVNTPKEDRQYHFAEALALTGFISMLASIPLFIASHRNKKKSMPLSLKTETAPQLQKNSFGYKSFPSLTLRIHL
ncbi:MAG TPA: hypothetical protein VIV35_08785 [Chitinophagaceae bacterium]